MGKICGGRVMIVVCPTCFCKYSVQAEAIGKEKLVRCSMCGATWQQSACGELEGKKQRVLDIINWTFFWSVVFIATLSLFFAKRELIRIWPPVADFYEMMRNESKKAFVVQNMSNFFVMKKGALYMGLKGELVNISDEAKPLPSLTISLKDDDNVKKDSSYKKTWTHDLTYKKLLPNQKVTFETELRSVPCNNLICDIKLDPL
jgi:predicted Zn finger-like uncharacterized protein